MPQRKLLSPEFTQRIENALTTLGNSLDALTVRNWLENFSENEWSTAITVLERIRYFSLEDIIKAYDDLLKEIVHAIPEEKQIFFLASSEYGKSGSAMLYFVKNTPTYIKHNARCQILTHGKKLKAQGVKDKDSLILVDDFVGTGDSCLRYYNHYIVQQIARDGLEVRVGVLCVAYLKDAESKLQKKIKNLKIFGSPHLKVFASRGSPFGYRPRMMLVRDFCYQYAVKNKLFETHDFLSNKVISHPLGYENSQALIVFEHSVPNNTLPIIWSAKSDWFPLYARASSGRINRSAQFRKESRYWISVARKLGFITRGAENTRSVYSNVNLGLFSVLRLLKIKAHPFKICQMLGISLAEYKVIIENGVKHGLFTSLSETLTPMGEDVFREISNNLKSMHSEVNSKINIKNDMAEYYIPKTFLGKG